MIDSDCSDQDMNDFQDEHYRYYNQYQDDITKLRTTVNTLMKNKEQGLQAQKSIPFEASTRPKLPSIQLPTFSGDLGEYEAFMDQFQAQIGYRTDLEPVTKLQYLKTQLKGRAFDLVKGFTSVSDNYQSAIDTLKETYGDEEKIKHCLLQNIVSLEPPKHNRSDLENFRINMLNLTRSLRNRHGFTCCEWIITSLFQHKLTNSTIRQLYLKYENNFFSLDQLNESLRDLISHMEVENKKPSKNTNQRDKMINKSLQVTNV